MRVVQLKAENFKRLKVVEINPDGNVVTIGGQNGQGKSSVLDAIYVALIGRSAAPPRPVRAGEEKAAITLDLGEVVITRTFTVRAGDKYTDTIKVETASGLRYGKPQEVLDALLGEIGFDPFEFTHMKPSGQAATLLQMVPLSVDLDELAALDDSDYLKRRDVNREADALSAQVNAIQKEDVPPDAPDRDALTDQLACASEHNSGIERERASRQERADTISRRRDQAAADRERIEQYRRQADELEGQLESVEAGTVERETELAALPPLAEYIDAPRIAGRLREADAALAVIDRQARRTALLARLEEAQQDSAALTAAMANRANLRTEALQKARMPINGLGFSIDESGKAFVTFGGVPFEQASTAEQLRASTAIAMAANPKLRVLRIRDGSLLDKESMKLLAEMAEEQDFQLWVEVVGDPEGVGFVMENGSVKQPDDPAKQGGLL